MKGKFPIESLKKATLLESEANDYVEKIEQKWAVYNTVNIYSPKTLF